MKKKFFVTAAVCALSAALVFGVTACNQDSGNGGNSGSSHVPDVGLSIQVANEEEWNAAFEKTATATNRTYSGYSKSSETRNGVTLTEIAEEMFYFDGARSHEVCNINTNDPTRLCYMEKYIEIEEPNIEIEEPNIEIKKPIIGYGTDRTSSERGSKGKWHVYSLYDVEVDYITEQVIYDSNILSYDKFTYINGKYVGVMTASDLESHVKSTYTLKINAEGYLSYLLLEQDFEYRYFDEFSGESVVMSGSGFGEYAFYNFGTTTISVPQEAKKAIEDYKAANNN